MLFYPEVFCSPKETDLDIIRNTFETGIKEIRELEEECKRHCGLFCDK